MPPPPQYEAEAAAAHPAAAAAAAAVHPAISIQLLEAGQVWAAEGEVFINYNEAGQQAEQDMHTAKASFLSALAQQQSLAPPPPQCELPAQPEEPPAHSAASSSRCGGSTCQSFQEATGMQGKGGPSSSAGMQGKGGPSSSAASSSQMDAEGDQV